MDDIMPVPQITLKILLLGEQAVGKTSLKRRLLGQQVPLNYAMTVGVDFGLYEINLMDYNIILQIWDLGGENRFKQVANIYYSDMKGVILVYDITKKRSFDALLEWVQDIIIRGFSKVPLLIIGNKVDLRDNQGVITKQKGEQMAHYIQKMINQPVGFVETSALRGQNVNQAFEILTLTMIKNLGKQQ